MVMSHSQNRYVTFSGIHCDGNAQRLLEQLCRHLAQIDSTDPWSQYFTGKLAHRQALGQDDLFFVGSQITQIREFLEQVQDKEALSLLDQLEEQCC